MSKGISSKDIDLATPNIAVAVPEELKQHRFHACHGTHGVNLIHDAMRIVGKQCTVACFKNIQPYSSIVNLRVCTIPVSVISSTHDLYPMSNKALCIYIIKNCKPGYGRHRHYNKASISARIGFIPNIL